jgi:serine/threonine-protein kinase RsbW
VTTSAVVQGGIALKVPGALCYRHLAIRVVSTACKVAGAAGGDFEAEAISACGEAFNNIAIHGYRGRPPGVVCIEVAWSEEHLAITFVDDGKVFDLEEAASSSSMPPDLDDLPERGMGLYIIRTCMDGVDYRPGPPNVLRLVKLTRRRGVSTSR